MADETDVTKFAALAKVWFDDCGPSSLQAWDHWAYRAIIEMGDVVVPLLLADLEGGGSFGFVALRKITGAQPVPESDRGCIAKMRAAWLAWGRKREAGQDG